MKVTTLGPRLDPQQADQLAIDLVRARTADIDQVAAEYRQAAQTAHSTYTGLTAMTSPHPGWSGDAADRFQSNLSKLPAHLETINDGYSAVSQALTRFSDDVAEQQSRYTAVSAQLTEATTQLATAQGQLDQANLNLTRARHMAPGPERRYALQLAQNAVSTYSTQVDDWQQQVDTHSARTDGILAEFHLQRESARHTIAQTGADAIVKPGFHVSPIGILRDGTAGAVTTLNFSSGATTVNGAAGAAGAVLVPEAATAEVKAKLTAINETVNSLMGTPYVWGGGHGAAFGVSNGGLDCSGFVSDVLHSAGYLATPQTTTGLAVSPGLASGAGQYVTIYDRTNAGVGNDHVIMSINGHFFEEGGGAASGGAMNVHAFTPSQEYLQSFNQVLHPVGL